MNLADIGKHWNKKDLILLLNTIKLFKASACTIIPLMKTFSELSCKYQDF